MKTKQKLEEEIEFFADQKQLAIKAVHFIQEQIDTTDGSHDDMFLMMLNSVEGDVEYFNEKLLQAKIELEAL